MDPPRKPFERNTSSADDPVAKVVDSASLLEGRNEIVIRHAGRFYRLRRTRLDKLILTA